MLVLKPSASQQADLDQLLEQQQDPSSPNYHQWLTPEEYADRFGVSQADVDKITAWLGRQNLTVQSVARARNAIAFSGNASQVESALGMEIHRYLVNGELHYANATDPSVPAALQDVVRAIQGLHDFRLKPHLRAMQPRENLGGEHQLAPDDVATIYDIAPLYNAGFTGNGQKLVVAGQTRIALSDIDQYRASFGLSVNDPQTILVPNTRDPGTSKNDLGEADLDLELSGAVARDATIIYVYSYNVMDAVQYAIDQNLAPVITVSYGECEAQAGTDKALLAGWATQAALQRRR
jgi:subtilase family serine protease